MPLARYVAEHEHKLSFPFRRYQIQPVYRGERPSKGDYREFFQCDIDVIGRNELSLRYDAEIPAVINAVFAALGFGEFVIRINNRRCSPGCSTTSASEPAAEALREVDKLEKRGPDAVTDSLDEGWRLAPKLPKAW